MTSELISELSHAWIANEGKYCPAWVRLVDMCSKDPENAWLVIQEIASREISKEIIANLAAGPLEDLLAQHGPAFIDRIEEKARNDSKFNLILGGVWQNTIMNEVWERVKKARNRVW